MVDRDSEDWQRLRAALYDEVGKTQADRALERLRQARQDLPASSAEWVPPLWFDESGGNVAISIEGEPRIVVSHGLSAAVYHLIADLVEERLRSERK